MIRDFEQLQVRMHRKLDMFSEQYRGVVVACSGGIDSTVLLSLFCSYNKWKKNFSLAISHTNFGLRGKESEQDQSYLEELGQRLNVPIFVKRGDEETCPRQNFESVQMWARRVRYEEFQKWSTEGWVVALGHHGDDLVENLIFRACRGTSPQYWQGMQEWQKPFYRPLLKLRRLVIEEYARQENIAYRIDSSNDKMDYKRNLVRKKIVPLLEELSPGAANRFIRLAEDTRQICDFFHDHFFDTMLMKEGLGSQLLSIERLLELPDSLAFQCLSNFLGPLHKKRKALSYRLLQDIVFQLRRNTARKKNWRVALPAGAGYLVADAGFLKVVPL